MPTRDRSPAEPSWDRLYEEAAPQGGYFTTAQAAGAGYSSPLVEYHIHRRRIERVARGIFRLVHFPLQDHEDLIVAWLWSGRDGVFSHQTALLLHHLSDALPAQHHLTVPCTWAKRRLRVLSGVILHYADLAPSDIQWMGPIPVTTPVRTLIDCARDHVSPELVQQARRELLARGTVRARELKQRLKAPAVRRGARLMKTSETYDYGDCHACGGPVRERLIKQDFWIKGQLIVIDAVPAGVCEQCGEKIVSAEVGQIVASLIADPERRRVAARISVPVIKYEKTAA